MNEQHEQHLAALKLKFTQQLDLKYRKGQAEHGGLLSDNTPMWLLEQAIDETIDQYTYLMTLKEQLENYHPTDADGYER